MFLWSVTWRWLVVTPAHYNVHTRTKSLSKILAADARPRFPSTSFQRDVTRSIYTFFLSFSSFFLFFPSSLSLSLSLSPLLFSKRRHATDSIKHPFPSMQILRLSFTRVTLLRMIHARTRVAPLLTAPPSLQSSLFSVPPSPAVPDFFFPLFLSPVSLPLFSSPSFCLSRTSTIHGAATSMDGRGLALRDRCDLFDCIEGA